MSKVFRRFTTVAVILLLGLASMGCGGSFTERLEASPGKVNLAVKATQPLTINTVPVSGTAVNVTGSCTYASSDESVATVSKEGLITGLKPGSATITVSYTTQAKARYGSSGGSTMTVTVPVEVK